MKNIVWFAIIGILLQACTASTIDIDNVSSVDLKSWERGDVSSMSINSNENPRFWFNQGQLFITSTYSYDDNVYAISSNYSTTNIIASNSTYYDKDYFAQNSTHSFLVDDYNILKFSSDINSASEYYTGNYDMPNFTCNDHVVVYSEGHYIKGWKADNLSSSETSFGSTGFSTSDDHDQILFDDDGYLYIRNNNTISRSTEPLTEINSYTFTTIFSSPSQGYVYRMYKAQNGVVFYDSFGGSLVYATNNGITRFSIPEGVSHGDFYDMIQDKDGDFWLACREGLFSYNNGTWTSYKNEIQMYTYANEMALAYDQEKNDIYIYRRDPSGENSSAKYIYRYEK